MEISIGNEIGYLE